MEDRALSPCTRGGEIDLNAAEVTTSTNVSEPKVQDFLPLERSLLLANGSLQRLLSSCLNVPILLYVLKHEESEDRCIRQVLLARHFADPAVENPGGDAKIKVNGVPRVQPLVRVAASYTFRNRTYLKYLATGGLGQLFSELKIVPDFTLLDVGRGLKTIPASTLSKNLPRVMAFDNNLVHFWRQYTLKTEGMEANILEVFHINVNDLDNS